MFVLAMLVGMIIYVIFSVSRVASLVVQVKRMLLRLITAQVAHIEEASSSGAAVAEDDGKGVGIPTQDKGDDDEDDPEVCAITAQHTAEQEHDTAPPQDEDSDDALSEVSLEDNTAAEDVEAAVVEPEDVEEGPPPPV
jgi:hypothetical protein